MEGSRRERGRGDGGEQVVRGREGKGRWESEVEI